MIDIGLNLSHASFAQDLGDVVSRAQNAGVEGFVLTGTSESCSRQSQALAERFSSIARFTSGVHPHDARHWNPKTARAIREMAQSPLAVAVGECGLDYDRNFSSVDEQQGAFNEQLDMALVLGKPVFLHWRPGPDGAACVADFKAAARPFANAGGRGVVHCFTGNREMLDFCLEMGFLVGVTGWVCDERRGAELQALLPSIPADRLLIETDAPYLTPRSMPGGKKIRRNEPAFLIHVAAEVARLRGESIERVASQTSANARSIFSLPPDFGHKAVSGSTATELAKLDAAAASQSLGDADSRAGKGARP